MRSAPSRWPRSRVPASPSSPLSSFHPPTTPRAVAREAGGAWGVVGGGCAWVCRLGRMSRSRGGYGGVSDVADVEGSGGTYRAGIPTRASWALVSRSSRSSRVVPLVSCRPRAPRRLRGWVGLGRDCRGRGTSLVPRFNLKSKKNMFSRFIQTRNERKKKHTWPKR